MGQARREGVRCEGNGSARDARGANAQAKHAKQHATGETWSVCGARGGGEWGAAHSSCSLIGIFCAIVPPACPRNEARRSQARSVRGRLSPCRQRGRRSVERVECGRGGARWHDGARAHARGRRECGVRCVPVSTMTCTNALWPCSLKRARRHRAGAVSSAGAAGGQEQARQ